MDMENFLQLSKQLVADYTTENGIKVNPEDVYVVWQCKTLQNAKALLATPAPDGLYFEATLNGDKNEVYFDAYAKVQNLKVEVK